VKANEKIAIIKRIVVLTKKSANEDNITLAGPSIKKMIKRKKLTLKSFLVVNDKNDKPESTLKPFKKKRSKRKNNDKALPAKKIIITNI
jgi:hypothetical protein